MSRFIDTTILTTTLDLDPLQPLLKPKTYHNAYHFSAWRHKELLLELTRTSRDMSTLTMSELWH